MNRIYLDDIRTPSKEEFDFLCLNEEEFRFCLNNLVACKEQVSYVSFDHDLGDNTPDGYDCAKILCKFDQICGILAPDFEFNVHSANPVGAENIRAYMNNYLKYKGEE